MATVDQDAQFRNAYPALRVFIFGQEVTEDVLSCSFTYSDDRAPNTAEVVLQNKFDRYVVEEADIHALYGDVDLVTAQLPDVLPMVRATTGASNDAVTDLAAEMSFNAAVGKVVNHIDRQIRNRLGDDIKDDIKRRILTVKVQERVAVRQPDVTATGANGAVSARSARDVAELRGEASRFPFQVGDSIFHTRDPIRIFWRDPLNSSTWYHCFAGFVSDPSESVTADGDQRVMIRCEDVSRILRYSRFTTNPGIFDIDTVAETEDTVIRTFFNDVFGNGLTLPEFLYTMIFGAKAAGTANNLNTVTDQTVEGSDTANYRRVAANGLATEDFVQKDGAGAFNFDRSITFMYGPLYAGGESSSTKESDQVRQRTVNINGLDIYQVFVDHEVRPTDLETMVLRGHPAIARSAVKNADDETDIVKVITIIGENPQLYPVDGGRLIILAPASLGPDTNRDILLRDIIQSVAMRTTFKSRLSVIYDTLARIEFSFYANPRGDLICEMPLYDFEPLDFGDEPVTREDLEDFIVQPLIGPTTRPSDLASILDPGDVAGPYAPHYRIPKRDTISFDRTFSDENIRTQMTSTWQLITAYTPTGTALTIGQPPEKVTLRSLVPAFGVRSEHVDPTGFIASPEAAQFYAQLKLNQWNANAKTRSTNMIPRLRPAPNRPLLYSERKEVATIRSVTHAIDWTARTMTMQAKTNYIRGWDGSLRSDNGHPNYSPIGGEASRPLNYARLFGTKQVRESLKTQTVSAPTKKKKSKRITESNAGKNFDELVPDEQNGFADPQLAVLSTMRDIMVEEGLSAAGIQSVLNRVNNEENFTRYADKARAQLRGLGINV